jgi:serine/threonine protein kinase
LGIHGLTLIGRGHFSEVYSCKDLNGQPTGRVVKVSKTASSLDSIKGGQAGTEAYAMYLGEMCAQSGKRSPFVRVMLDLILLAVPAEHDNRYVSVLFMEEGVRTVKEDVLRLAAGIHLLDGSFSQSGLTEAAKFVKAVLEPLAILHSLQIAHRDLKPANMLIGKDKALILSDAGMAVFPTSLHRPVPSPGASPPAPAPFNRALGSSRAQGFLKTAVPHSPPVNLAKREVIHVLPSELKKIFSHEYRDRENAGTHVFCGPEFPFPRRLGTLTSNRFLPGDLWAVGWIFLQILSGYKVAWMMASEEKTMLSNSSPQDFWVNHLHRGGTPSTDPTVLSAIDLVRGLLKADPAERLTCSAALEHPFLLI